MSPLLLAWSLAHAADDAPRDVVLIIGSRVAWSYEGAVLPYEIPGKRLTSTDLDAWRVAWYLTGTGRVSDGDVRILTTPARGREGLFRWPVAPATEDALEAAITDLLDDRPERLRIWLVWSGHGVKRHDDLAELALDDKPLALAELQAAIARARPGRVGDELYFVADACYSLLARGPDVPRVVGSDWGEIDLRTATQTPEERGVGGRLSILAVSAWAGAADLERPAGTDARELNEFLSGWPLANEAQAKGGGEDAWQPRVLARGGARLPPPGPRARRLTLADPGVARWVVRFEERVVVEAFTWGTPLTLSLPPARYRVERVDHVRDPSDDGLYVPRVSGLGYEGGAADVDLLERDAALERRDMALVNLAVYRAKDGGDEPSTDLPVPVAYMPASVLGPLYERRTVQVTAWGGWRPLPLVPAGGGLSARVLFPVDAGRTVLTAGLLGTRGDTAPNLHGERWPAYGVGPTVGLRVGLRDAAPLSLDVGVETGLVYTWYETDTVPAWSLVMPLRAGPGALIWLGGSRQALRLGVDYAANVYAGQALRGDREKDPPWDPYLDPGGLRFELGWSGRL